MAKFSNSVKRIADLFLDFVEYRIIIVGDITYLGEGAEDEAETAEEATEQEAWSSARPATTSKRRHKGSKILSDLSDYGWAALPAFLGSGDDHHIRMGHKTKLPPGMKPYKTRHVKKITVLLTRVKKTKLWHLIQLSSHPEIRPDPAHEKIKKGIRIWHCGYSERF